MKKFIISIFIIIALLVGGFFVFRGIAARQQATLVEGLETVPVQYGALESGIGATGNIRSNQSALLFWEIAGQVGEVRVKPGDQVAANDILATLKTTSLPPNVILAQTEFVNSTKALDNLLNSTSQQAAALQAVDAAENALEDALNPEVAQAQALEKIARELKAGKQKYPNGIAIYCGNTSLDEGKPEIEFFSIEPIIPVLKVSMYDSPLIDREAAINHPYDLAFEVEKTGEDQYTLITTIKLFGGSFYISPHSTGDFKGKFTIEIAANDKLKMGDDFLEIPRSKEVIDMHPFVDGPVNWVNADTRYKHRFTVISQEDFDIGGKIFFTIEPKCTLEEIPLMFKYRSGVLTVEKWKC